MKSELRRTLSLAGCYGAWFFLQLVTLRAANSVGLEHLPAGQQELVYYALQVFAILGFCGYAAARRFLPGTGAQRGLTIGALGVYFAGTVMMFVLKSSPLYLAVSFAALVCITFLGGAVYERMSAAMAAGERAALALGIGSSAAIGLQYLLQLRWSLTVLLVPAMFLAFLLFAASLLKADFAPAPVPAQSEAPGKPRRILSAVLTAAILLLFICFYNEYIHHLQVRTGFGEYNVYTWPRLMMIPCYLFFGLIGDRRQGKYLPVAALCIALTALLNAVLIGVGGAYWVNMCLFYIALAAAVCYYNLSFWRLAPGSKHPALWPSMGRMMDSASVLAAAGLGISTLPTAAVLTVNILGLAALILLMALNGDFDLSRKQEEPTVLAPETEQEKLDRLSAGWGLTPKETEILRAVLHSDLPTGRLAEELGMGERTLYRHLSSIYEKTGTDSRLALLLRFHNEE